MAALATISSCRGSNVVLNGQSVAGDCGLAAFSMVPLESETLLFRVRGGVTLAGGLQKTDEGTIKSAFSTTIKDLIKKVNSQSFILSNHGSTFIVWPKSHTSSHPTEMQDDAECIEILKFVTSEFNEHLETICKNRAEKVVPLRVINLHVMFELGRRNEIQSLIMLHDKKSLMHYNMILPIDVVLFAHPEEPWGTVQDQFVELITSQLSEMEKCIQKYTKGKTVPIPQPFHFELPEKTTLTTIVYPAGVSEENLEPQRQEMHTKFGLDDKPYFRRTMAFSFPNDDMANMCRRNKHKYIPLPDPESFKIYIVHGYYDYHHVLEDEVNDAGWGAPFHCIKCVISWFKIQGYYSKLVPSVSELQQLLVNPENDFFVDSIEWIGSLEILEILTCFEISAGFMLIHQNGTKALDQQKLATHFIEEGTPIIISCNPQAFVLLGLAISKVPKQTKFLLLDPEIIGVYNMPNKIENVQAIGWRSVEFWNMFEYYNIFLPVRPKGI